MALAYHLTITTESRKTRCLLKFSFFLVPWACSRTALFLGRIVMPTQSQLKSDITTSISRSEKRDAYRPTGIDR